MIELENHYQDAINQIQAQYRDTNIKELLDGIAKIKEKYIKKGFESLINDNISLTSAKGDALDLWGRFVKFYRYIPLDNDPENNVNYFNFDDKNFNRLQFANPNAPNYGTLTDDVYREFVVLLFQKQFVINNAINLSEFLSGFFKEFQQVAVRDTRDMSYQVFVFVGDNEPPAWLTWILQNYDILPRPAGVGTKWSFAGTSMRFGFAPEGTTDEYYFKNVSNFDNSNFVLEDSNN